MRSLVVRARLALALTLLAVAAPTAAFAQGAPAPGAAPPAPGGGDAPAAAPAAAEGDAPAKPAARSAPAGYAYDDKPAARARPTKGVKPHGKGPVATLPGFQALDGGGSRLFVQLSAPVPVEERKAKGSLTYVLKGAHVRLRNNTNALVTVHFDTPVSRARLVPAGNDLHLVVDLRAAANATWAVKEGPEKSSMLVVDFPKGDYLPKEAPPAAEEPAAGEAPAKPAPAKQDPEAPAGAGPTP